MGAVLVDRGWVPSADAVTIDPTLATGTVRPALPDNLFFIGLSGQKRSGKDTVYQLLADRYRGKRLNSPNDLVYRSDGTLFFTDPPFVQDPLEYSTRTHHTNLDVYERAIPQDLIQNAIVVATFAYQAATRDALMPRKPLPAPRPAPAPPGQRPTTQTSPR